MKKIFLLLLLLLVLAAIYIIPLLFGELGENTVEIAGPLTKVEGIVLENSNGCTNNGADCFVEVKTSASEVVRIYYSLERESCSTDSVQEVGELLVMGDKVSAFGHNRKFLPSESDIEVCSLKTFYLNKL